MNISKKLKGLLAACVAAVGLTAFAVPTVTVDKVETYQTWSTIGVSYTLGGTDSTLNYKVAFDVTADGRTTSVTNGVITRRPAGDVSGEEVVAFGEQEFWLGPDEIAVAWAEMEFVLTAFRELSENPTTNEIRAAIEASGAKDSNRILALINGASDIGAVYDLTKDLATPVEFTVTPGDGTSEKAFLRIRK